MEDIEQMDTYQVCCCSIEDELQVWIYSGSVQQQFERHSFISGRILYYMEASGGGVDDTMMTMNHCDGGYFAG